MNMRLEQSSPIAGYLTPSRSTETLSGSTESGNRSDQQQQNKALHPTAYSPLVPRSLSAAGELVVVPPLLMREAKGKVLGSSQTGTLWRWRVARLRRAVCGLSAVLALLTGTTNHCTGLPAVSSFVLCFCSGDTWLQLAGSR